MGVSFRWGWFGGTWITIRRSLVFQAKNISRNVYVALFPGVPWNWKFDSEASPMSFDLWSLQWAFQCFRLLNLKSSLVGDLQYIAQTKSVNFFPATNCSFFLFQSILVDQFSSGFGDPLNDLNTTSRRTKTLWIINCLCSMLSNNDKLDTILTRPYIPITCLVKVSRYIPSICLVV